MDVIRILGLFKTNAIFLYQAFLNHFTPCNPISGSYLQLITRFEIIVHYSVDIIRINPNCWKIWIIRFNRSLFKKDNISIRFYIHSNNVIHIIYIKIIRISKQQPFTFCMV